MGGGVVELTEGSVSVYLLAEVGEFGEADGVVDFVFRGAAAAAEFDDEEAEGSGVDGGDSPSFFGKDGGDGFCFWKILFRVFEEVAGTA